LVLLALSWLGWRSVTLGVAAFLTRSNPAAATRWRPDFAAARLRAFEAGDDASHALPERGIDARRAIRAEPLDGRGYWWLARIAEAAGKQADARRLYALSAERGPRNVRVLAWLAERELGQGHFREGIAHIDQLLRVQPELSARLLPIVYRLAIEPKARKELVAAMARQPPWRPALMPFLFAQVPQSAPLAPFLDELRQRPPGLSQLETNDWIDRLARDHNWGAAYIVWTQSLSPDESARIGNVFNGGFENEPSQSGFDWRFEKVPGAHISRIDAVDRNGGRSALQVEFEDRRVPFQHVRQQLALVPGHYRLSGRVKLNDLRSERGLVWTVFCAEDGRTIGESEPMMGRKPWHSFSTDFDVPADKCGGQWLTLRIPARIPAEQLVGGSAVFDDLKIKSAEVPLH
jgi:hypothetical protein